MTAAQLFQSAAAELSNIPGDISQGNFAPLLGWLREHVHSKGKFLGFNALMIDATGSELDAKFFKQHLQARYAGG